jgi:hypothetical protein
VISLDSPIHLSGSPRSVTSQRGLHALSAAEELRQLVGRWGGVSLVARIVCPMWMELPGVHEAQGVGGDSGGDRGGGAGGVSGWDTGDPGP